MSNPTLESTIHEILDLKRMREELDATIATLEDRIKAVMGDEEHLTAGAYKVSWKTFTSSRIDTTALKKALPEVAAQFTKQTTARRFSINKAGTPTTASRQMHHAEPARTTGSISNSTTGFAPSQDERSKIMDIYAAITDRIIAQMDQGIIPWQKPWISSGEAISHATGKPYSLLNQMLLGRPGEYLTFKQCQAAGGKVKKGEKAQLVVFWKWIEQEDEENGETKEVPFLRYYNVFHIDQCEGISARYVTEVAFPDGASTVETAQDIIYDYLGREGVKLVHQEGDKAFYRPATDEVVLPIRKQFVSTAEYYSTVFHELTHSTGHQSRLNRLNNAAFFGNEEYSKEELVAEIGAAALVNHCGLESSTSLRNNAAYIQNWLGVLKNDKRFIVSAAGKAEKAVNLILNQ